VGLPEHGSHRVVAHRVTHRLTQLARAVVEPADSKRARVHNSQMNPIQVNSKDCNVRLLRLQGLKHGSFVRH
jgi:hypothetical protein